MKPEGVEDGLLDFVKLLNNPKQGTNSEGYNNKRLLK